MATKDSKECCRRPPSATCGDDVLWVSPAATSEQLLAISSNLLLGLWWGKRDGEALQGGQRERGRGCEELHWDTDYSGGIIVSPYYSPHRNDGLYNLLTYRKARDRVNIKALLHPSKRTKLTSTTPRRPPLTVHRAVWNHLKKYRPSRHNLLSGSLLSVVDSLSHEEDRKSITSEK